MNREQWREHALGVIRELASAGRCFTVEDLRAKIEVQPHHPNEWGAVIGRSIKTKLVFSIGFVGTVRTSSNARFVRLLSADPVTVNDTPRKLRELEQEVETLKRHLARWGKPSLKSRLLKQQHPQLLPV